MERKWRGEGKEGLSKAGINLPHGRLETLAAQMLIAMQIVHSRCGSVRSGYTTALRAATARLLHDNLFTWTMTAKRRVSLAMLSLQALQLARLLLAYSALKGRST